MTDTNTRIARLRSEAAIAGDYWMVKVCELALGRIDAPNHHTIEALRTPENARRECLRILAHAKAQEDS